jgi:hypothetical protein
MILQQALIHRTEFFDVEGSVIDATGWCGGRFAVVGEMPERLQEVAVGDGTGVQVEGCEQFAVERGDFQDRSELLVGEHLPQNAEAAPEVLMVVVGMAVVQQAAQACDAVVLAVDRIGTDESAVLGDEKEQQAIDQAQQLPVKFFGGEQRAASSEQ